MARLYNTLCHYLPNPTLRDGEGGVVGEATCTSDTNSDLRDVTTRQRVEQV